MKSKKQRRIFLTVTLLTISMLAGTIFLCARKASDEMTQHSFDELTASTKRLAEDYYSALKNDQMFLTAVAELIAKQESKDVDTILQVMNSFDFTESFLTSMILLLPDGQLLHKDGRQGRLSFRPRAQPLCAGKLRGAQRGARGAQRGARGAQRGDHRHPLRRDLPAGYPPRLYFRLL